MNDQLRMIRRFENRLYGEEQRGGKEKKESSPDKGRRGDGVEIWRRIGRQKIEK